MSPCSIDNRIKWFVDNKLYFDAINCALKNRNFLKYTSVTEVGRLLINYLISKNDYETAIKFLPQVLLIFY